MFNLPTSLQFRHSPTKPNPTQPRRGEKKRKKKRKEKKKTKSSPITTRKLTFLLFFLSLFNIHGMPNKI